MFGKNPQRAIAISDGSHLFIQEVFHTIQGEGPFSGMPAIFIRLAGCNLACTWCDTEFESAFASPTAGLLTTEALIEKSQDLLRKHPATTLFVITGGEPMRQNIAPLINQLLDLGGQFGVQIETAGTIPPQRTIGGQHFYSGRITFVVSPKTAKINSWFTNLYERTGRGVHLKYVISRGDTHPSDGLPYLPTQIEDWSDQTAKYLAHPAIYRQNHKPGMPVWVSPCDDHDAESNRMNMEAAVESCLQFGYRLSLQTHKIVGVA